MENSIPTSLKQAFQGLIPDNSEIVEGTVIGQSPLKITLVNDPKMILTENSVIVPNHLTKYTTTVSLTAKSGSLRGATAEGGKHEHQNGTHEGHTEDNDGEHTHDGGAHVHELESLSLHGVTVTIDNSLKTGDTVTLLVLNNKKRYYVLDRKG